MSAIRLPLFPAILLLPLSVQGTVVTTITDEDNGILGAGAGISLREAVKYGPTGDIITFVPPLSNRTIRLTLGEITVAKSLTIDASALPGRITLTGDKTGNGNTSDDTRIFNVTTGTVTLDSLILDKGYCPSGTGDHGAAIHSNSTSTQLTVRNSTISNNKSTTYGGGIYFIGALNSTTSFLKIEKCRITGNNTGHDGGAIHMTGTLQVDDSTFSANSSYNGGAIFNNSGGTTVTRSTFSDNPSYSSGGAVYNNATLNLRASTLNGNSAYNGGGGLMNAGGNVIVENSTFTANTGSAILTFGGAINVRHATIVGNFGSSGAGIHKPTGSLSVSNSIVAQNNGFSSPDILGSFIGTSNLIGVNALLAPLGDYGGPTQTMLPQLGSPAINRSPTATVTTDQRGFSRINQPDSGAVEYSANNDLTSTWRFDSDGDGSPNGTELALGTDPAVADSSHSNNLTAPTRNAAGQAVLRFGIAPAAAGTSWILRRSTNLVSFTEIYRYNGTSDTAAPGVTFVRTATGVTVVDGLAPAGRAFYRFEARYLPLQ